MDQNLEKKLVTRMEYIARLDGSWEYTNPGDKMPLTVMKDAEKIVRSLVEYGMNLPGIFPIGPTEISIEWIDENSFLSIDVTEDDPYFYVYAKPSLRGPSDGFNCKDADEAIAVAKEAVVKMLKKT